MWLLQEPSAMSWISQKIPEEDRALIPEQTATYNKYRHLIQQGEYYRIASYRENHKYDCWALSSQDKKKCW